MFYYCIHMFTDINSIKFRHNTTLYIIVYIYFVIKKIKKENNVAEKEKNK